MIKHFQHGITLTITTCKRINYFKQTIEAFLNNCIDASEIKRIIVSDDRSPESERSEMQNHYPKFEFVWRDCGHARSLDLLFKMVHTEYFFHLEDDRPMLRKIELLKYCREVMTISNIDSFICGLNIGSKTPNIHKHNNESYYIHKFIDDGRFWSDWDQGNTSWPGFYLAPGMHRTSSIISIPYEPVPQHERSYALKYHAAGFKVAFNCGRQIFGHLTEISAYDNITNAPR